MGLESEKLKVIWLGHLLVLCRTGKCWSQHVYCILNNKVIVLLETRNKCKNDQCPTPQECESSSPNHKREVELVEETKKMV
jgi:hypothetical protein